MSASNNSQTTLTITTSDNSQTALLIEKPKYDSNGKWLTKINISQYTNVDRKIILSLKVLLFNLYFYILNLK